MANPERNEWALWEENRELKQQVMKGDVVFLQLAGVSLQIQNELVRAREQLEKAERERDEARRWARWYKREYEDLDHCVMQDYVY
jgi:hypothetical protein